MAINESMPCSNDNALLLKLGPAQRGASVETLHSTKLEFTPLPNMEESTLGNVETTDKSPAHHMRVQLQIPMAQRTKKDAWIGRSSGKQCLNHPDEKRHQEGDSHECPASSATIAV